MLLQINKTSQHALLFPLVEHLCLKNKCKGFRDDTATFREILRSESLQLLQVLCGIAVQGEEEPFNRSENGGINSLDDQVNWLESIRYDCATWRTQRLKHFVCHLYSIDIVTPGNLLDVSQRNPSLAADLVKPLRNVGKCCDIEIPLAVKTMTQNKWYQSLQSIEENMFWTRINVISVDSIL